ncbi:hypothetical protein VKT23_003649 [Stygiomarasmius scandens]|uniref:Uncharacterized protein n=1 Tax=Marasmiellus scandens TaxID=2682957 RepID=A0ABR1K265_9AGAR
MKRLQNDLACSHFIGFIRTCRDPVTAQKIRNTQIKSQNQTFSKAEKRPWTESQDVIKQLTQYPTTRDLKRQTQAYIIHRRTITLQVSPAPVHPSLRPIHSQFKTICFEPGYEVRFLDVKRFFHRTGFAYTNDSSCAELILKLDTVRERASRRGYRGSKGANSAAAIGYQRGFGEAALPREARL